VIREVPADLAGRQSSEPIGELKAEHPVHSLIIHGDEVIDATRMVSLVMTVVAEMTRGGAQVEVFSSPESRGVELNLVAEETLVVPQRPVLLQLGVGIEPLEGLFGVTQETRGGDVPAPRAAVTRPSTRGTPLARMGSANGPGAIPSG
jgi:hypothetical protein